MRANQLRLYFSTFAYALLEHLRRLGLRGTSMRRSQCDTLRLRLLKIGAVVKITVRRIWVALSSGCPFAREFRWAAEQLLRAPPAA